MEPHAPYTCSPPVLERCNEIALRNQVRFVIHLSENDAEVRQILDRYGHRPVAHLGSLGILGPHVIADHCVAVDDHDMELLSATRTHVAHNPESNMKLASGISPVPRLLELGVNVALGTDGCASNNNLDLFGEMDSCAKLHKVATLDPTALPAETVLKMTVGNGAAALGMDGEIGRIAPGFLADLIVVDLRKPHLVPLYNPVSHLVYAARSSDVRHSIIHGRLVMEDRKVLTFDVNEVMERVREFANKIRH